MILAPPVSCDQVPPTSGVPSKLVNKLNAAVLLQADTVLAKPAFAVATTFTVTTAVALGQGLVPVTVY